jgi:hypothetical protein
MPQNTLKPNSLVKQMLVVKPKKIARMPTKSSSGVESFGASLVRHRIPSLLLVLLA